ncbi:PAS domain S-box-containing protein [Christiangramia gaetbulicola]|uniref:histidine kinase n=2 Tax=Christiangramia gaetbulicola TaxID=703340 RepID=A0A2T6AIE8_9FLAO|nr:PAS domain S-box-containing protein [Christiangramia gaetbulicola]
MPTNDLERVKEVHKYDPDNNLNISDLNFLSEMAAEICNTQSALITLISKKEQWVKAAHGIELEVRSFPREFTFCAHTINSPDKITVIPDARTDPRFNDNPFVTGDNPVVFYAGLPLVNSNGYAIGTICAVDENPRTLNSEQKDKLRMLGKQVMNLLELKRKSLELIKTNKELEYKQKQFNHITSGTATATYEWTLNSNSVKFNSEWWNLTGYEKEEFDGRKISFWENLVHQKDIESVREKLLHNFKHSNYIFHLEFRIRHKKGFWIWIETKGKFYSLNEDGQLDIMYGLIQDISDKKKKNIEILYWKRLLDSLYELSPLGIALNDYKTGIFLDVNNKLIEPTGYTKNEFLNLSYWDVTPKSYEKQEEKQLDLLKTEGYYGPYEKEYIKKDGSRYPVLLRGVLVKDEDGNLKIWSFIEDISKRKKNEAREKKRLNHIKQLLEVTEDQNDRLKNFAHIVSHNLRSHSSGISMLIEFLAQDSPDLMSFESFNHLKNASTNLESTIHDLNDIVEVNLTSRKHFQKIKLSKLIDRIVESVEPLATENKVIIQNEVADDVTVYGLKSYMDSITLNLITNAIKYSSVERNSHINIKAEVINGMSCIMFRDNGIGIDLNQHKQKIFKLYKTFHRHPDSRGVGLFLTKNQIEAMDGRIEVESQTNKGTTFKIYLPNEKN